MRRSCVVALLSLVTAVTALAADYQVPGTHPRIFVFAEDIPTLAERCQPGGYNAQDYADLKKFVDGEGEAMRHSATSFAFVSLIEKHLGHPTERYVTLLKKHILDMAQGNMIADDNWWHWQTLIAADWVWETFTPEEKQQLAKGMRIEEAGTWPYKYYHENVPNWRPGAPGRVLARLIRSLCFYGEGVADEKVKAELDRCYEYITRELGPALNLSGGPDPSGFGYATFTETWSGWHLPIWQRFGVDVWKNTVWGTQYPEWYLYCKIPFEEALVRRDDATNEPLSGPSPLSVPLFLQAGSKAARWWVDYLRGGGGKGWFAGYLWTKIIWDDGSVGPVKIEEFPLCKYFTSGEGPGKGMGLVVWRSGWDKDATLFDFRSGDYYYGHQHRDTGSFILHKGGHLAIDPGPYFTYAATKGEEFDNNYHHAPVAHNLVALFEADGTPIDQRVPSPSDSAYYMHKERPDNFNVGDILAYEDTQYYAYVLADITPAYDHPAVKRQLRAVVYLKPDTFVIYDRTLTDPGVIKRWLLHTKVPPFIAHFDPQPGKMVSAFSKPDPGVVEHEQVSSIMVAPGEGLLKAKVLLPDKFLLRTIGGEGYRYWVNGKNYHYGEINDEAKRSLEAGVPMIGWGRVEVEDSADDSTFLVVLNAPSGEEFFPLVPARLVKEGRRVGAKVADQNRLYTVLFTRELLVTGHITITDRDGKTLVDKDLATDLHPESYHPSP